MKFITVFLSLILSTSVLAGEKRDAVLDLLEITQAKKNHELMIETYIKQFASNPVTSTSNFEKYFREALSWDSIIEPTISIYVDTYTVEELKYINEFYSSPIGQSFIAKSPEVMAKSSAIIVSNVQNAIKHLQQKNE